MCRDSHSSWRPYTYAIAALTIAAWVSQARAVVLIDTGFTAAEGYNDGSILFQQPNGAGNGIWLGQDQASGGVPAVDSVAGVVNTVGGPGSGGGGNFRRNAWSLGAVGGALGGDGSGEQNQAGFQEGDRIKIDIDYQLTLGANTANTTFFNVGVKDCFASCSFEASPFAGLEVGYNNFEDGTLKVFTDLSRAVFTGADNPFALLVPTTGIGIDNGFSGEEPVDLVSDNLSFSYEAELMDTSLDLWQATEVIVTNLDTQTVVAQATVDNPGALESFIWNSTAVDDPFTPDVDEGGVARGDGSDMFLGVQWLQSGQADDEAAVGGVRFEYLPNLPPVPGDYTGDGLVDAADYTVWRDTNESIGSDLAADGTGDDLLGVPDGDVDSFDLDFWAANYGAPGTPASSAIPEPSAVLLVLLSVSAIGLQRR